MKQATKEYLDEIKEGFEQILMEAKTQLSGVDTTTLNTPEAEKKWSMLQCLKHMSLATGLYNRNISKKLEEQGLPPANTSYHGNWKGRLFAKMNAPKPNGHIPAKLKTFKSMDPIRELNADEVTAEFMRVHENMIQIIDKSRTVNVDRIKIATALGPMVKLTIGEAYRFILAHTRRHMVQLQRIKATVAQ